MTLENAVYMESICALAANLLDEFYDIVKVGVTTNDLNNYATEYAKKHGVKNAPLGYKGFPKSICTSLNDVICHGIPSNYILQDGDFLNIDVTLVDENGWHGDSSRMYFVGDFSSDKHNLKKKLTLVTYNSMMLGVEQAVEGNRLSDIAIAIQRYVEKFGFSVVREFCGHGIGKKFHQEPNVLHYLPNFFRGTDKDVILTEGMTFTIEPMINSGGWKSKLMPDKWTAKTKDGSLSAQFEHTIAITKAKPLILTKSKKGRDFPSQLNNFTL